MWLGVTLKGALVSSRSQSNPVKHLNCEHLERTVVFCFKMFLIFDSIGISRTMHAFWSHKATSIPINHRPQKRSMATGMKLLNLSFTHSITLLYSHVLTLYFYIFLMFLVFFENLGKFQYWKPNFSFHGFWAGRIGIFLLGAPAWPGCIALVPWNMQRTQDKWRQMKTNEQDWTSDYLKYSNLWKIFDMEWIKFTEATQVILLPTKSTLTVKNNRASHT